MLKFGRGIAKNRVIVLIISVLLLIPSVFGYVNTKVNYDILYYLPDNIETMQGQEILLNNFGKGAYALFIANGMQDNEVSRLKAKLEAVPHVAQIVWYDSIAGNSIPQELLPEKLYDVFHSEKGTLMAIFFDEGTSSESTLDAIAEIRRIGGSECFLSSMSAIVADTRDMVNRELFWYVLIAVVLSAFVLALTMDSWMAPVLFLTTIGMAVIYNLGSNIIQGEISFITMSLAAVLQLAVTMDYSIFLWNSYREEAKVIDDKNEAMASAIEKTINSVVGSSLTTVAGFIALCFMSFTLGRDLGIVMAKGVVIGVICCVTILPAFMLTFDCLIKRLSHRPLNIKGEKLSAFIIKNHRAIIIVLLLLWIPALYGYKHMQVYYNLDASLPDYLPSVQANKELNENYTMNTIFMVLADEDLPAKDSKRMLSEMQAVPGVNFALGESSLVPSGIPSEFLTGGLSDELRSGGYQLILVSSEYAVATDEVNEQIETLNGIIKSIDPGAMLIGEAPCTKDLITITDKDFSVVSLVSIGAIFVLIFFVLGSVSLPVILVLIIELAIYINLGMCWYLGSVQSFIASIVIGTIQLGATVDYAILMTNRFMLERSLGHDKYESALTALSSSMESIVTSAMGFFAATIGVGLYSDVDLISSICVLMGRGALISMFLVLTMLPSAFIVFDGLIRKTSWKHKRRAGSNKKLQEVK